ncbi:MAG: HD domain-containing protein [Planctomycetes bacterium]|nr:HD domain-containing protein [Planctomycetota bacterium]
MSVIIDRFNFNCATEIFKSMGSAAGDLQIYTANHPRFQETVNKVVETVWAYFQKNPQSTRILFTVNEDQIEFQRIPLMNLGPQGERLIKRLKEEGCEGLEFQPGVTAGEIVSLVQNLVAQTSASAAAAPDPAAPEKPPAGDAGAGRIQLHSKSTSRDLSLFGAAAPAPPSNLNEKAILVPELWVTESTYRSILATYRTVLANLGEGRTFDYRSLKQTSDQVITLFSSNQHSILPYQSRYYFDDFTFHHSVNVSFIATFIASGIVKDRDKLNQISIAALLHDVGKSRVPAEIIQKPAKLTPSEFQYIQIHPVAGAEILMGVEDIEPLCVAVAFGHHITRDANSYPKTRWPYQCDWITELLSVVDIYEALTACRPYKKGLSYKTAFEVMLKMPGLKERLPIVKMLFDRMGPYPIGTIVELTSGERAVVVEQNPSTPFHPKVVILTDCERHPLPAPVNFDLADPNQQKARKAPAAIAKTFTLQNPEDDPLQADLEPEPEEILGNPLYDDGNLMAREG